MTRQSDAVKFHTAGVRSWVLLLLAMLILLATGPLSASTKSLLILHTNDMHDHLRPGYIGIGGLPYVSGFVHAVRAERDDVLLLDAGDVLEKGDLLGYRTHGLATFEALGRIGYDAVTVGNHDLDFGVEHLRKLDAALGHRLVLLNLVDRHGEPVLEPSRVVEVNGLKVGIIGMIAPRRPHFGGLDHEESGRALAAEAERLKRDVHLVIALSHQGSRFVADWARMAPAVDVFVAGHHHEALLEPLVAEDSGAIIVSAGSDAHWVGHLELEVDLEQKAVVGHSGGLNLLRHDRVPVDDDMLTWLADYEAAVAPEARDTVIESETPLGWFALGRLAAEAIRLRADADVGLYHPTQIIRNGLPAGSIDVNALFRISAERADPLLRLRMTGAEISAYMTGLAMSNWGQTQWAGMHVTVRETEDSKTLFDNDLEPDRHYSVVMPEREWQRFMIEIFDPAVVRVRRTGAGDGSAAATDSGAPRRNFPSETLDFRFFETLRDYLAALADSGESIADRVQALAAAQGDADPNEARHEPRFLARLQRAHYLEMEQRTQRLDIGLTGADEPAKRSGVAAQ